MHTLAQHLEHQEHRAHLTLRAAAASDQAFLQQLYASTRDDLRLIPADPGMIAKLIDMQQHLQTVGYRNQFPDATHQIVLHHNAAVGRVVVNVGSAEIRLVDFALLPAARKRGFGRAILHALQQMAAAKSLPLTLRVSTDNPHAKRLYLATGFLVQSGDALAEQLVWQPPTTATATAAAKSTAAAATAAA
jgi:ribosomal protein S18 acetylase RimI-like enzyme